MKNVAEAPFGAVLMRPPLVSGVDDSIYRRKEGDHLPRADKVKKVERIVEGITQAPVVYLLDFQGLTVAEISDLRKRLRPLEASVEVVKNTLALRAADQAGVHELVKLLVGPTAFIYCYGDAAAAAKAVQTFIREKRKAAIKGGLMEHKAITAAQVEQIAYLPGRDELRARVVGGVAAPLYGLVTVLSGPVRGLVTVLDRIRDKKAA